jgi:RNA polymerase sigma factor (sigma-70 family)
MDDSRSDAALVAAYVRGDRGALGEIYDRYAAALLDLATGMLRDPHDAADVVQDVFVVAAQSLDRLREPDRLRSWLFAVARHEVFRRTRSRSRTRPTDFTDPATTTGLRAAAMTAPADPEDEAGRVVALELASAVRAAAAGLDNRDQLVLELVARQGLEGRDLADALGVTESQCHVLVHRMRQRVQRSLGALTVARMGRADCPPLRELLADWDGAFTVLIRKRVARHVDGCAVCTQASTRYAVIPLLALLPIAAAPADLRARVLSAALGGQPAGSSSGGGEGASGAGEGPHGGGQATSGRVGSGPASGYRFDAPGGFPRRAESRRQPAVLALAGLSAVVLVIALVIGGGSWLRQSAPVGLVSISGAASTAGLSGGSQPTVAGVPGGPSTAPASGPGIITGSATATSPLPRVPDPGRLVLSQSTLDLGAGPRATLELRNAGGRALSWGIAGALDPFVLSVRSGALAPGARVSIQVGIDRTALAEGQVRERFVVTSSADGGGAVTVTAAVDHPPTIGFVQAPPAILVCPWSVAPTVAAVVTDEAAITGVKLTWTGPGPAGSSPLTLGSVGHWTGRLALGQTRGIWTWQVAATDARGNVGTVSGTTSVRGTC